MGLKLRPNRTRPQRATVKQTSCRQCPASSGP